MGKKKGVGLIVSGIIIILVVATFFIFRGLILAKVIEKVVLREGKPVKFGAYTILIKDIQGHKLSGIKISEKNRKLEAKSGEYEYLPKENAIKLSLVDGTAEAADPKNPKTFHRLTFKQMFMKLKWN